MACSRPAISPRPPARSTLVGTHLAVDVARGDAEGQAAGSGSRLIRISRVTPPTRSTSDTPFDALEETHDGVVDEPRQLLGRHGRRAGRIGDDRQAFDLDARRDRLLDGARQIGADALHGVLDVVEGAVGVGLEPELDRW